MKVKKFLEELSDVISVDELVELPIKLHHPKFGDDLVMLLPDDKGNIVFSSYPKYKSSNMAPMSAKWVAEALENASPESTIFVANGNSIHEALFLLAGREADNDAIWIEDITDIDLVEELDVRKAGSNDFTYAMSSLKEIGVQYEDFLKIENYNRLTDGELALISKLYGKQQFPRFPYRSGITHAGVFHADEVFTTAAIRYFFNPRFTVERKLKVTDTDKLNEEKFDVFIYDIGQGAFDHHQKEFDQERENGIPYSSFGLFWREFGPSNESIKKMFDRDLVQGIDAVDNGAATKLDNSTPMTISSIIRRFNLNWTEAGNSDDAFEKAVSFATKVIDRVYKSILAKNEAKVKVYESLCKRKDGIMVLDKFMPWQEHLFKFEGNEEVKFIIYPGARGGYNIQGIPVELGSFQTRIPFPEEWRGVDAATLQQTTGIKSMSFCHNSGFLAAVDEYEDAFEVAKKAMGM